MIEETVIAYLTSALQVPVAMETPAGPPAQYVTVEKTGSGEEDRLSSAVLAIQSHAGSLYAAAALNHAVKAAMKGLTTLPNVFRSHCETDYNYTNEETRECRYQAVFHVYFKE